MSEPDGDATRAATAPGARWAHRVAWALAVAVVVGGPLLVVAPWLVDASTYGFHDWDVMTSHRHLVVEGLRRHGELPWWNPYACGGFPAWGYVEGATVLVSPFLPVYLLADIRAAIRLEVLGMAFVGAAGTFAVAGRYTSSLAGRSLAVALFAFNGRFALQAASGHAWHLAYAIVPWCWFFADRAFAAPRPGRDAWLAGAAFAWLVYAGGIYPLPHAVLLVGGAAVVAAVAQRGPRPLVAFGVIGLVALGLAAPKLAPLLATFSRAPRLIESTESLSISSLVTLLTSRDQGFHDRPAPVTPYGWHEWGMYVSAPGALLLLLAPLGLRGRREGGLLVVGGALLLLGLGAFHPLAPWSLLHEHVPVFRSQHVPSRFLYPAVLVLGVAAGVAVGRLLGRLGAGAPWAEPVGLALVALLALDVALVGGAPMKESMWMRAPERIERRARFSFAERPPIHYLRRDWAGPLYLAMRANQGVIQCYGVPPFDERGALARSHPDHRGEAVVTRAGEVVGEARVEGWSHNTAIVDVTEAPPGARLVYNMNFDRGWQAEVRAPDGVRRVEVVPDAHRVAVALPPGSSQVRLRYVPPGLGFGLALAALTLGASAALALRAGRSA